MKKLSNSLFKNSFMQEGTLSELDLTVKDKQ